jgi:hypothetical protein
MRHATLLLLAASLAWAWPVCAEEPAPTGQEPGPASEKSTEELAKESQNPVADIYSFPFQDNLNFNYGPNQQVQNVFNFQPVIPIHAGPVNIITRTIVPVISNTIPAAKAPRILSKPKSSESTKNAPSVKSDSRTGS